MRLALIATLMLASAAVQPAVAQQQANAGLGGRVDKLEKEMRAVQRKVFPGGSPQYFEPEIAPPATPATPAGTPATTPLADLTTRVDALEQELSRLTGQIEQNNFKARQLEEALAKFKADAEYRLTTLEGGPKPGAPGAAAAPGTPSAAAAPAPLPVPSPAPTQTASATVTAPSPSPPPATTMPAPAPAPVARANGDPAEDAYLIGYRLWEAKRYGEAATSLKEVVAKYPKHRRASYAQNLLGRTYLDQGKPAMAAEAFYANYQKMPRGERAPDSLYYLAQALVQLKKPSEACKVYDELQDVYGATMSASLKGLVVKGRTDAKCAG